MASQGGVSARVELYHPRSRLNDWHLPLNPRILSWN